MNTSTSIAALAEALAKAQGEITFASKSAANPFFRSKYADLASVWDAIRAALSKNGLAVIQNVETVQGSTPVLVSVETILCHSSGEWSRSTLDVPVIPSVVEKGQPPMVTPQGIGSAITYARRYALAAIVGVAQADDDGNSASGKDSAPAAPKMSEEARANHQAAIEGADTMEALKTVWGSAVKACGDDQEALKHLTVIKDAMKSAPSMAAKARANEK